MAIRASPQTDRVVEVMNILSSAGPLTLSEIARRTGVNKSTMYSLLVALTRSGWVLRHPVQKTFHLGPELMVLGRAATDQLPVIEMARPVMLDLVDEFDVPCRAFRRLGSVSIVVDAIVRGDISPAARGQQFPIRPPFGSIFAAYDPPAIAEEWCQSGNREHRSLSPAALREELAAIRRLGYSTMLAYDGASGIEHLIDQVQGLLDLAPGRRIAEVKDLLELLEHAHVEGAVSTGGIKPGVKYRLRAINTAVLDPNGQAMLAIQLGPFDRPLSAAAIKRIGERLRDEARRISAALGRANADGDVAVGRSTERKKGKR
jgi:DNA-binding IclR family transcriptional regulator